MYAGPTCKGGLTCHSGHTDMLTYVCMLRLTVCGCVTCLYDLCYMYTWSTCMLFGCVAGGTSR